MKIVQQKIQPQRGESFKSTRKAMREFYAELSNRSADTLPQLEELEALLPLIVRYLKITPKHPLTLESFEAFVRAESLDSFAQWCANIKTKKAHKRVTHSKRGKYLTTHKSVWTCRG